MGDGGVETLEKAIGCTHRRGLHTAFRPGRFVTNRHPSEKKASQLGGQSELEGAETA